MANNLLMRNLSDFVNDALSWCKEKYDMKNNTDAAEMMLRLFPTLFAEKARIQEDLQQVQRELSRIRQAYDDRLAADAKLLELLTREKTSDHAARK